MTVFRAIILVFILVSITAFIVYHIYYSNLQTERFSDKPSPCTVLYPQGVYVDVGKPSVDGTANVDVVRRPIPYVNNTFCNLTLNDGIYWQNTPGTKIAVNPITSNVPRFQNNNLHLFPELNLYNKHLFGPNGERSHEGTLTCDGVILDNGTTISSNGKREIYYDTTQNTPLTMAGTFLQRGIALTAFTPPTNVKLKNTNLIVNNATSKNININMLQTGGSTSPRFDVDTWGITSGTNQIQISNNESSLILSPSQKKPLDITSSALGGVGGDKKISASQLALLDSKNVNGMHILSGTSQLTNDNPSRTQKGKQTGLRFTNVDQKGSPPDATKCHGWDCTTVGQFCPPGVPGSWGPGFCCQLDDKGKKKWGLGKCSPPNNRYVAKYDEG
jgi:hypothetical protein